jgi:hypothetical protein
MNEGGMMSTRKDEEAEWAGDVFARINMHDIRMSEKLVLYCLIEMTSVMKEMKDRITKIEIDLDYHVYLADDFKDET